MTRFEDLIPGKVIWGIPVDGNSIFALVVKDKNVHEIVNRVEKKVTLGRVMLLMPSGTNMWFDTSNVQTRDYDNPFETNIFGTDEKNVRKWILSTDKVILVKYYKNQLKKSMEYLGKIGSEISENQKKIQNRYCDFIENTQDI